MDRIMRLLLMYDLPFENQEAVKQYQVLRRKLISRGYIMIQFSVYTKVLNTVTKKRQEIEFVRKYLPNNGNIRIIMISDKQYDDTVFLRGGKNINESINNASRRIKIQYEDQQDKTNDQDLRNILTT